MAKSHTRFAISVCYELLLELRVVCPSTGDRVGKAIIKVGFEFSVGIPIFCRGARRAKRRLPLSSLSASGDKVEI